MKKNLKINLLLGIFSLSLFSTNTSAQKLEKEQKFEFPDKVKKRILGSATFDQQSKTYAFTYVNPGKNDIYTFQTLLFNEDFNFLSKTHDELDLKAAANKYKFMKESEDAGKDLTLLTVENNFGGQVVLKKGFLTQTTSTTSRYAGGGQYWESGYSSTKFTETDKIKPKAIEGKKINLIAYKTDQPKLSATLGTGYGFASTFQSTKKFSEATGDVLVIGMINPDYFGKDAEKEPMYKYFTAMSFSAQTLEMKKKTDFNFDFPKVLAYQEELPNGDFALVFAAQGYANLPRKKDPDGLNYTYMRLGQDGSIKEKIDFKSLSSKWAIYGISMQQNGDVFIYGPAAEDKDTYFDKLAGKNKFEQFLLMKISSGKISYYTSAITEDFEKKLQWDPLESTCRHASLSIL